MHRLLSWCGCLTLVMTCGCAVCASSQDCKFAAYGGVRSRTDMVHGRVASVFDPAPEVIQPAVGEQSPQLAIPESDDEADSQGSSATPDVPLDAGGDILRPEDASPDSMLPELPNGTIELPEIEPNGLPSFDGSPAPQGLPPDLPGNSDRSAQRHPLRGLFDE